MTGCRTASKALPNSCEADYTTCYVREKGKLRRVAHMEWLAACVFQLLVKQWVVEDVVGTGETGLARAVTAMAAAGLPSCARALPLPTPAGQTGPG